MFILCVSLLLITHTKYKNHVSAPKIKPQNFSKCMAATDFLLRFGNRKIVSTAEDVPLGT